MYVLKRKKFIYYFTLTNKNVGIAFYSSEVITTWSRIVSHVELSAIYIILILKCPIHSEF